MFGTFPVETPLVFTSLVFTSTSAITVAGAMEFPNSDEGFFSFFPSFLEVTFLGRPEDYPAGAPSLLLVPVPEPAASAAWFGLTAALLATLRRRPRAST